MFCSVFCATFAATCPIKKSENFGGRLSYAEYPIWIASQSLLKSFLQSSRFTWNSSGCNTLSSNVIVAVSVKSQVASLITLESLAKVLITSLYFTLGLISMLPLSRVSPLNNAAEIYFPANSPA